MLKSALFILTPSIGLALLMDRYSSVLYVVVGTREVCKVKGKGIDCCTTDSDLTDHILLFEH